MQHRLLQQAQQQTRRYFLGNAGYGIGAAALAALMSRDGIAENDTQAGGSSLPNPLAPKPPHFPPKRSVASLSFSKEPPVR